MNILSVPAEDIRLPFRTCSFASWSPCVSEILIMYKDASQTVRADLPRSCLRFVLAGLRQISHKGNEQAPSSVAVKPHLSR